MLNDSRFDAMIALIDEKVDENANATRSALAMKMQRCYAVKEGQHILLDVARKAYEEVMADMQGQCGIR
jgi:hypothetical protein